MNFFLKISLLKLDIGFMIHSIDTTLTHFQEQMYSLICGWSFVLWIRKIIYHNYDLNANHLAIINIQFRL